MVEAVADVVETQELATIGPVDMLAGVPVQPPEAIPRKLRQLVFGRQGSGKTRYAATAAMVEQMCPVLHIDLEGGSDTIAKMKRDEFPGLDIHIVIPQDGYLHRGERIHKWKHFDLIYEELKQKKGGGYKTIIIDRVDEGYDLAMAWWLESEYRRDTTRDLDLPGAAGGQDDFGRDWNKARSLTRKMMRGFRDLETHIIYTCHDGDVKPKSSNITINIPAFPGKLANEAPGLVSEVSYLWAEETGNQDPETKLPIVERRLQCQPTRARPYCKSRNGLPMVMQEPTVAQVVDVAGIPLD